jgi:hypothetical protein
VIIGACVVYNNSHIFHKSLQSFNILCDKIIVIDDGSNDCNEIDRRKIIEYNFKKNFIFGKIQKTEKEIQRRSELWNLICDNVKENDWIILLDSDECIFEKDYKHLLDLMKQNQNDERIQWIALRLYNMWTETQYRIDGYWNPKFELKRRIFKLHKGEYKPIGFNPETVECGEVPEYVFNTNGINTECHLLHLGYITDAERQRKYEFHKRVDPEGKFHLNSHINSIIEKPELVELK